MKFWLDTEFIEDGKTIDLVSIGVVAEDGHEFYRQCAGADLRKANDWVRANVLPKLDKCPANVPWDKHRASPCTDPHCVIRPNYRVRQELFSWIGLLSKPDGFAWEQPEFWGYYADYDWVAVCQLFGRMVDLPDGWPMYCRDIKQWADEMGNPRLPEQTGEHHALADARWNRTAWEFLDRYLDYGRLSDARQERRSVDQESSDVRSDSPGSPGVRQGGGGGDQQLSPEEGLQEGQAQVREDLTEAQAVGDWRGE